MLIPIPEASSTATSSPERRGSCGQVLAAARPSADGAETNASTGTSARLGRLVRTPSPTKSLAHPTSSTQLARASAALCFTTALAAGGSLDDRSRLQNRGGLAGR